MYVYCFNYFTIKRDGMVTKVSALDLLVASLSRSWVATIVPQIATLLGRLQKCSIKIQHFSCDKGSINVVVFVVVILLL
jgi:hypothetical protein